MTMEILLVRHGAASWGSAGKFWEDHSKEMLKRKGWIEVSSWKSCFWQPATFQWLAREQGWELVMANNPVALLRRR